MSENTITASGSAEVMEEPDAARVVIGVEEEGTDRDETIEDFNQNANTVKSTLSESFDLDEDQINTISYNFSTVVENANHRSRQSSERFGGAHYFQVEVHDIEVVGELLSVALDEGATDIREVEYTLSDETRNECKEEALEIALESARKDAEVAASFENYAIDGVLEFDLTDSDSTTPGVSGEIMDTLSRAGSKSDADLEPDDVTVELTVEVTYSFS
jgi:uncharacterized protein YggE